MSESERSSICSSEQFSTEKKLKIKSIEMWYYEGSKNTITCLNTKKYTLTSVMAIVCCYWCGLAAVFKQVSTLLKAKCPQNGMYSIAVKNYNKDTDEGKSYWQAWMENKSLSSEKKLFQSLRRQFLFAAPTHTSHCSLIGAVLRWSPPWGGKSYKCWFSPSKAELVKVYTDIMVWLQQSSCCLYFRKKEIQACTVISGDTMQT